MKTIKKAKLVLIGLIIVFCLAIMIALSYGQINISFITVIKVLSQEFGFINNPAVSAEDVAVIWNIRMPRILVGILVGAALAVSGAVMQGVFANPLADPGIMGVSSGASLGAVLAISLGLNTISMFYMPLLAFIMALITVFLTVILSLRKGKIPIMVLLLAGVVISIFIGALTSGILTFMNEIKLKEFLFWTVGGLDYRRWEHVYLALGPIIFGLTSLLMMSRHLNILVLGEDEAKAVGMTVMKTRIMLMTIASLTTATAVCVSGSIGFVGLVVPHMMRLLLGTEHRILLPASALAGSIFLILCDTIGRIIIAPTEIRVGIMTALLGAPYFLILLRKAQLKEQV